jgi:hypothetical protein
VTLSAAAAVMDHDDDYHDEVIICVVTQVEALLESYQQDVGDMVSKWERMKEDLEDLENYLLMKLDMARNRLLTVGRPH